MDTYLLIYVLTTIPEHVLLTLILACVLTLSQHLEHKRDLYISLCDLSISDYCRELIGYREIVMIISCFVV
jgi:hypothetical protein